MRTSNKTIELLGGPLDGGVILWPSNRPIPQLYWFPHMENLDGSKIRHVYQWEVEAGDEITFVYAGVIAAD